MGLLAQYVVSIISFIYPVLQSMRAIETNSATGKWLTYWIIYASFTLFETIGRPLQLLQMIPFYYTTKLGFLVSVLKGISGSQSYVNEAPKNVDLPKYAVTIKYLLTVLSCGVWHQST